MIKYPRIKIRVKDIMKSYFRVLRSAFTVTLPILTGFIFLGTAYGILMTGKGFGALFTILISVFMFAGSLQFVGVSILTTAFNPLNAFFMAIMVNARHLFYGIAMFDRYKIFGKEKPIMVLTLCDETFSVLCNTKPPEGVNEKQFMLTVSVLDYLYWAAGTAIGATVGNLITFNTQGIDFSLTALFVVIFVNQLKESKDKIPALIGILCSVLCLLVFGAEKFIIPSMFMIIIALLIYRKPFERKAAEE